MKNSRCELAGQSAHCVPTTQKLYSIEAFTVIDLFDECDRFLVHVFWLLHCAPWSTPPCFEVCTAYEEVDQ